jgi:pimeloyl-ACP methyl ester carboxylesterase
MHDEALGVLPVLLERLGMSAPILVGHSDGASIALIYAAAGHPTPGLVLIAPHVIVETRTVAAIEAARQSYRAGDLRARLARHHRAPDPLFDDWSGVWLSPEFRSWNLVEELRRVRVPMLVVQGADDEYGTLAQVDTIAAEAGAPVETLVLEGVGHAPHLSQPAVVAGRAASFIRALQATG